MQPYGRLLSLCGYYTTGFKARATIYFFRKNAPLPQNLFCFLFVSYKDNTHEIIYYHDVYIASRPAGSGIRAAV
jgi:hypothetical protein